MQKYQQTPYHLLADDKLETEINVWQSFHNEAVDHEDEMGVRMIQERIDKMKAAQESRKQSA